LKVSNEFVGGGRVCRRGKSDCKDGQGHTGGDEPFPGMGPVHGIIRIVLSEFNHERVLLGPLAMVDVSLFDVTRIGWWAGFGLLRHCSLDLKGQGFIQSEKRKTEYGMPFCKFPWYQL
jgi:hypothetical protein